MSNAYQVVGQNKKAEFTLKIHRGDGMALLAMNWKKGTPPADFVGFAIEYREPGGSIFFPLKNRISFEGPMGEVSVTSLSTKLSPIQKFRWVHFPFNAGLPGAFTYRVTPVYMNVQEVLGYGEPQEANIELQRETYPDELNVTFTRGFVSSQAFVDRYESKGKISTLLPAKADAGLGFKPTHPLADKALAWMGFEARSAILEVLDQALADAKASVYVAAYDLNETEIFSRLQKLGKRLKVIIDDSGTHKEAGSSESKAAAMLEKSAGKQNVLRQHMGQLQHNKTIVVDGPKVKAAVCGSTNFSWRGLYVQNNNAVVVRGSQAIKPFVDAFEAYWAHSNSAPGFGGTPSARWAGLGLPSVDAKIAFSPHAANNALLAAVAGDLATTASSLFYSLAFLYQTPGVILNAINKVTNKKDVFVYGISDREVGGIELLKPDGNLAPVSPGVLAKGVPPPFKAEPTGGGGVRMHHKFLVIDFDKPTARVYLGSYNFSATADLKNGENLVLIKDRRVATSYMIQALTMFDHYHFRLAQLDAKKAKRKLVLAKPPAKPKDKPWWEEHYTNPQKIRDRELFA